MDDWRTFEFYLPSALSPAEATSELRRRVLIAAADGGEFVRQFRIADRERHATGWIRWTAAYLPGPPRIGRFQRTAAEA